MSKPKNRNTYSLFTSNEPDSHGFIAYKIKPKNDVVLGDIILNQAGIVFDFNEPIITNMVSTEIVGFSNIKDLNQLKFVVQPVPSLGVLNVKASSDIIQIEIYNALGQLVLMNTKQKSIDLSTLPTGTYFCKAIDHKHQSGIKKIIKK